MLPRRLSRRLVLITLAVSVSVAMVVAVATAAVSESCDGGTGLVAGALIASDGDQCGDDTGTNERDWEAIANQFSTYVPDPSNPPASPNTQGISVPDDTGSPDSTAFVTSAKEDNSYDWDIGPDSV